MEEILAKKNPNESLISHTQNVLRVWDILSIQFSKMFGNNEFWELSFIASLFHDFGKASIIDNQDVYVVNPSEWHE